MKNSSSISEEKQPEPKISTLELHIAPEEIAYFKAVVESYDNLITMRTDDPRRHLLKLWYSPAHQGELDAILEEMALRGPVVILARNGQPV